MWRSIFLALGAYAVLLGAECLVVDRVVLKPKGSGEASSKTAETRNLTPPEWAPWSLLSCGAVTMLYSFTIPNRGKD